MNDALQELRMAQRQVEELQAKLDKKLEFRNDCLAAMLADGGSPTGLAREIGLTRARIYQLIETLKVQRGV